MGAILYAGPSSAAAGEAAAWVWELDGFRASIVEVSTLGRKKPPQRMPSGRPLVLHRVDQHLVAEIVSVSDLPVTSPRRTILDLAGRKHRRTGRSLDEALRRGLTTLGEIWLLYEEEWIRGRRGVAILRDLLVERTPGEAPTQSDLEDLLRDVVRDFQLPHPVPQFEVHLGSVAIHVDFAYPDRYLAIECDGFAHHADRVAFDQDRERDIELQARGWRVLRFTWAKLRYEPDYVARQIRLHLGLPSARL
jgi:very-short-patch-repair endonuclease